MLNKQTTRQTDILRQHSPLYASRGNKIYKKISLKSGVQPCINSTLTKA